MPVNFALSYAEYAGNRTNAPASFHQYAAVVVCAAALENRVYVEAGFGRVYPSLWLCFVGPSTVRKSTAVNLAANLLTQAKQDTELPQDFSREALTEHLSHRPYGLLRWSEIGVALEAFSRDYNAGVLSTLTDIWDSRASMTRLTKSAGLVEIRYPALSILAAGKIRWFQEYVRPKQIGGGFLGRWLFVGEKENLGYRSFFSRNGTSAAAAAQRDSLVRHLKALSEYENVMEQGAGGAVLDHWLEQTEGKYGDDQDPAEFSKRAGTQVVKLAIGIQACLGTSELGELLPEAVKQAIQLWERSFVSGCALVNAVLAQTKDSDALKHARDLVQATGTISRRDLCRQLKMKVRDIDELVATLIEAGEIRAYREEAPGGMKTLYEFLG